MSLNFEALRYANELRAAHWPGNDLVSTLFRAVELAGEAGEVCEAIKKYERAKLGIAGSTKTIEDVAEELGDLIIAADLLAMDLGLDLGECVKSKFNKTSAKLGIEVEIY